MTTRLRFMSLCINGRLELFNQLFFNQRKHHLESRLVFSGLHRHLPPHPLDQAGGNMESPALSLTLEISLLILFGNLTGIRNLGNRPLILSIRPYGEASSFFGYGVGSIVEEIVQDPLNVKGITSNP